MKLAFALFGEDMVQELKDEIIVLAMIGTLADVCELTGENRVIVNEGLRKINAVKIPGLQRILVNTGIKDKKITTEDIGFRIAPRLNAAGRIGDPLLSFRALTDATGTDLADQLEALNAERQHLTQKHVLEAEHQLAGNFSNKILIASGRNLHPGIIGLVAGRLAEKYHRPTIVMSESENSLTGSCRSPLGEFNITEALRHNADLLEKFGGHRQAAGFRLNKNNQDEFENGLFSFAEQAIPESELTPTLLLDLVVNEPELSLDVFRELQQLAPFGQGNPEPLLLWEQAKLNELRPVGQHGDHLRLKAGDRNHTAIAFRFGEFANELQKRETVDLVFTLDENVWNGNRELQLKIVDMR